MNSYCQNVHPMYNEYFAYLPFVNASSPVHAYHNFFYKGKTYHEHFYEYNYLQPADPGQRRVLFIISARYTFFVLSECVTSVECIQKKRLHIGSWNINGYTHKGFKKYSDLNFLTKQN